MSARDQRPMVGVAHVVLHTDRMQESVRFMRAIGMRPLFYTPQVSVYEVRGGTHLLLMLTDKIVAGDAAFDLMVDDLHAAHQRFTSLGLAPSPIETRPAMDHVERILADQIDAGLLQFDPRRLDQPLQGDFTF